MEFEPDYSVDEPEAPAEAQPDDTEPSAEAEEPQVTEDDAAGGVEAGVALQSRLRAGGSGATPPPNGAIPEEWQVRTCCCWAACVLMLTLCNCIISLSLGAEHACM